MSGEATAAVGIPHQSYGAIFLRFLRFGSLAWGGPVAQIGMIQRELVDEERWITKERFRRALAVYQVLPGPEAHELCVYFGMLARGRLGGFLAGLGFMLPGFLLMFTLSWLYVGSQGSLTGGWAAAFAALQAAVLALIVRAVHRIGAHAAHDKWLLAIAAVSLLGSFAGAHFSLNLLGGGAVYALLATGRRRAALLVALAWGALIVSVLAVSGEPAMLAAVEAPPGAPAKLWELFWSGLKSGLLTFGGAYTVIPFLQEDAVGRGGWMTNAQFLDGIALSGILPAPLIIFATFVGFVAGGVLGAVLLTIGIFLPAFLFTLVAHDPLERLTAHPSVHGFLDGVTAAVVGLIAATAIGLAPAVLDSVPAAAVFAGALTLLYLLKHRLAIVLVIGLAAAAGLLFF